MRLLYSLALCFFLSHCVLAQADKPAAPRHYVSASYINYLDNGTDARGFSGGFGYHSTYSLERSGTLGLLLGANAFRLQHQREAFYTRQYYLRPQALLLARVINTPVANLQAGGGYGHYIAVGEGEGPSMSYGMYTARVAVQLRTVYVAASYQVGTNEDRALISGNRRVIGELTLGFEL